MTMPPAQRRPALRRTLLALSVGVTLSAPAQAQSAASVGRTAGASILGAVAGATVGALAGGSYTSRSCPVGDPDACLGAAFPGALWGIGIGTTVGAPLGAYVGSGRRNAITPTLLASAALFAAEVVALRSIVKDGRTQHEDAAIAIVIAVPILQVATSTYLQLRR
jgi:hypothetical protein